MRTMAMLLAALLAGAGAADAQQAIDVRRSVAADGRVEIENISGSVRVTGWDRAEVHVTGTLGRGAERVDVDGRGNSVRVRVVLPRTGRNGRIGGTDLVVRVPVRSRLSVETVSAPIEVGEFSGDLSVESVSGNVDIEVASRSIRAGSVSGAVTVSGSPEHLRAQSVSGPVRISGARGTVHAETVSGSLGVEAGEVVDGTLKSVSGSVSFNGGLSGRANLLVESHSGTVTLTFPADIRAEFDLGTFSGGIRPEFEEARVERNSRYTPERSARFTVGGGGARVIAKSFSGSVVVRRR